MSPRPWHASYGQIPKGIDADVHRPAIVQAAMKRRAALGQGAGGHGPAAAAPH